MKIQTKTGKIQKFKIIREKFQMEFIIKSHSIKKKKKIDKKLKTEIEFFRTISFLSLIFLFGYSAYCNSRC